MKVHNKVVRWDMEPWTIVRQEGTQTFRHKSGVWWYAFNTRTGDRKPARTTYKEAEADIPKKHYSEPWGL